MYIYVMYIIITVRFIMAILCIIDKMFFPFRSDFKGQTCNDWPGVKIHVICVDEK